MALKRILQYNHEVQNQGNKLDEIMPLGYANNSHAKSFNAVAQQIPMSSQSSYTLQQQPSVSALLNPFGAQMASNSNSALATLDQQGFRKISNRQMDPDIRKQMAQTETRHAEAERPHGSFE